MASSKVSSLTASDALAGTELFYADGLASAVTSDVKVTSTQIKTWTSASPTLVTPVLGVATGTSIALGGATIGTNALAVTGTTNISGNTTLGTAALLLWSTDVNLSRNAAGVIQFGTTAANAAGSLLATNGTFTGGTLIADNGAAAVSPFIVKDNGTAVFTIADGGSVTTTSNFVVLGVIGVGNNAGFARGFISGTSTTSMVLWDASASDFGRLQLGGTTSSFPSLKRSLATIQCRLADDSADADFKARLLQTAGFTVATLPAAGTAGRMAYVTDALAPSFLTTVVGGGAVVAPVFDNGTNWVGA